MLYMPFFAIFNSLLVASEHLFPSFSGKCLIVGKSRFSIRATAKSGNKVIKTERFCHDVYLKSHAHEKQSRPHCG